jgi:putative transposase
VGPCPTDRAKPGTKKSIVVEAAGGPLGIAIAGANVHDTQLLDATLNAIVVQRPQPTVEENQNLCLDKGYDNPTGRQAAESHD